VTVRKRRRRRRRRMKMMRRTTMNLVGNAASDCAAVPTTDLLM
jgi:hypothetical protein